MGGKIRKSYLGTAEEAVTSGPNKILGQAHLEGNDSENIGDLGYFLSFSDEEVDRKMTTFEKLWEMELEECHDILGLPFDSLKGCCGD